MIPKFRAWDKEGNRMILPKYLQSIDLLREQVTERTKSNYTFTSHSIPFDKVELMQSTGLKDKNSKEIFEGDILAFETDEGILNVNIYWDSKHALFMFKSEKYNEEELLAELVENNTYPFEIAGNIYENPELLEVE